MARHELLNNITHQHTHVVHHFGSQYGDNVASVPVFPTEFIELQKDYPILFRRDKEDGPYQAIVLLGFSENENLFLDESAASGWDARYIPASVERGPFLIGFQRQQDMHAEKAEPVVHIDMDHPKVTENQGQPLFLSQGGNSPYLEYISLKLQAIHQGMELQKGMFATFEQLNLIEPINIEFELNSGKKHRLIGNYGINEERLAQLNGQQLEQLHRAGYLQLVFSVVSSMTNIRPLIERKNRQSDRRRGEGMSSAIARRTQVIEDCQPGQIPPEVLSNHEPVVLKGLVSDWKLTELAGQSDRAVVDYLSEHYNGRPSQICCGEPGIEGRYFYDESVTRLNYETRIGPIDEALEMMLAAAEQSPPPSYYIASNVIHTHFPRLREQNDIRLPRQPSDLATEPERVSIWIGNRSLAACHYDASDNLACCVAGHRRFSLFPPEQIANLYPGPLEPTPGGQAVSMVDFVNPDLSRFPNFPQALQAGQVAELEPGDAIYLPSMWWHQVEALDPFNLLINYWWSEAPRYTGSGMNVLYHALLCLRDKPEHERRAWKEVLDYYVFDDPQQAGRHLPEAARGMLGELDEPQARQLRAMLLNRLNR